MILDIFYDNWCYPNCIATVFRLKTITVIVPLQKFREKLSKGAITNDHSNGSTSPSRLSTIVTITRETQKPKVFSKVAVFTRNRTNKQLWQKVTIPFLIAKIQHFVSITNINNNNPKFIDVMVLRKTSFRSCFKLGTHSTMLWLYDHIIWSSFHLRNKNENENCLWTQNKYEKLKTNKI